jgi:D-serine deaminase-like pyridoxal phosphate-dependent protein
MPVGWISAGSTPTATFAAHLRGVSELRAGVYMFQDLFQLGLGVCRPGDLALTVLSTVIGVNRSAGRLVLDAGALALSKDRSTAGQARDCGYGQLCELNGQPVPGLVVDELNQEHGMAHCRGDRDALARFPVGSRVRILPNHACLTAAAHEAYAVVEGGTEVIAVWPRCNGW